MNPQAIIDFLTTNKNHAYKKREISKALKIPPKEYPTFKRHLKTFVENGSLIKIRGGRYKYPDENSIFVGELYFNSKKNGIVKHPKFGSVNVGKGYLKGAISGDTVKVCIDQSYNKFKSGKILEIVNPTSQTFRGVTEKKSNNLIFLSQQIISSRDVCIDVPKNIVLSPQEIIEIRIINRGIPRSAIQGEYIQKIGSILDAQYDVVNTLDKFNLHSRFPGDCETEALQLETKVDFENIDGRIDYTSLETITIDPLTAKDFDDALSLVVNENNEKILYVHIADVSHFVLPNSSIDKEARQRGTSIYFVNQCVPMLPEILTTNLCSLKAGVNRFTVTVEITLNAKNEVQSIVVNNGVINSNARLTYVEAQKILDDKEGERYNLLSSLQKISKSLRKKRFANGSLNLDIPEVELELDNLGNTTAINVKSSIPTHGLIEEIMLLANQCIAKYLTEKGIKLLHRNHEQISYEDLYHINGLLSQLSTTDIDSLPKIPTSKDVQKLMNQVSNNEIKPLIESLLLRALPKANYSTKNKGHFGLSFENYCHFTSPIRRYPDLVIHRLIKGEKVDSIEKTAIMNSNSEVVALKAEREFTKIKQLRFLMNKENEVLSGRVNGMNRHGMFIQIDDVLVDGYVRAEWMEDDYYYFDEKFYYFIGRRYKQKFKFGQKVMVKILNISILQQRLDLKLVL